MQPLNQYWSALKALFKRQGSVSNTPDLEETRKPESFVRDLKPAQDPLGGASKGCKRLPSAA